MAHGPRTLRPVENRSTACGARVRWPTWRGCLRGHRATRSIPRYSPRIFFTDTAPGQRAQLRNVMAVALTSVPHSPRALRPVGNGPTALGARPRWKSWCGCLRGQRATRSTPRRWSRLFFADTSPGRRLRPRNVVAPRLTSVARDPRALRIFSSSSSRVSSCRRRSSWTRLIRATVSARSPSRQRASSASSTRSLARARHGGVDRQ